MRPRDRSGLMAAHLTGPDMALVPKLANPIDDRARGNSEPMSRHMTAQTPALNRSYSSLPKIQRIRSSHPCRPPYPASILNPTRALLGIPNRFEINSSRSSPHFSQTPLIFCDLGLGEDFSDDFGWPIADCSAELAFGESRWGVSRITRGVGRAGLPRSAVRVCRLRVLVP